MAPKGWHSGCLLASARSVSLVYLYACTHALLCRPFTEKIQRNSIGKQEGVTDLEGTWAYWRQRNGHQETAETMPASQHRVIEVASVIQGSLESGLDGSVFSESSKWDTVRSAFGFLFSLSDSPSSCFLLSCRSVWVTLRAHPQLFLLPFCPRTPGNAF